MTKDGIPTPSGGKHWNHQTFVAGRGGKRGMIGNQLYIGRLVWNANHTRLNPDNGKKTKRRSNPEDLIVTEVPHLRIIPQALWDRANAVAQDRAEHKFGPGGRRKSVSIRQRNNFLAETPLLRRVRFAYEDCPDLSKRRGARCMRGSASMGHMRAQQDV